MNLRSMIDVGILKWGRSVLAGMVVLAVCLCYAEVVQAQAGQGEGQAPAGRGAGRSGAVDRFMGDWQGRWTLTSGSDSGELCAQVIALGKDQYRMRLIEAFDSSVTPYGVIDGQRKDRAVEFAGASEHQGTKLDLKATIQNRKLTGTFEGKTANGESVSGTFELTKTVRLSPTLEAKPPEGAVVLFDGRNFDQWEQMGGFRGVVRINSVIGGADNAAAYLRSSIWSDKQQNATLELGSDDGVKVWLNGEPIHANNASRGVSPGQDKVKVTLKQGWNNLLLKVTNGGADWGACARFVGSDNRPLAGIKEMVSEESSDTGTDEHLKANGGYITIWKVAGPFKEEGKDSSALFDVAFAPEKGDKDSSVVWKKAGPEKFDPSVVKWKLADGAMEVAAGTGSIVTKKKFKDFKLHIEFRTPFMPEARGQGRGNSGVYLQGRYEVQVLDSYGLESKDNECGGIYQVGAPLVNMCAPPMQWQTYDITYHAPRFDEAGKKVKNAVVTVLHNGVVIHDNKEIPRPTGGALDANENEPGAIYLQDHGNPVQYRNIWVVEL